LRHIRTDATKVGAWRKQAELIRERYGAVADEMPPQRFSVNRLTRRSYGAVAAGGGSRCGLCRRQRPRLDRARVEAARPSDLTLFTADALDAYRL